MLLQRCRFFALIIGSVIFKGGFLMLIKFTANDISLHIGGSSIIPTGCVNTPDFTIELSEEWQGYSLTVQFADKERVLHVAGIEAGEKYPIPWECLTSAGAVAVSLMGVADDKVKTTLPAVLSVRESAVTSGSQPQTPTASAYEQYVNLVNQAISEAYNEFEHSANKIHSMIESHGPDEYPTAFAVEQYLNDSMMSRIYDEMAEFEVWGVTMPSAVAKYVLEKTYKPTWHKTEITVEDDTTRMITLKDIPCLGAKVYTTVPRTDDVANLSLNFFKDGESDAFFRVNTEGFMSSTNEFTYGLMSGELKNGLWDGEWCKASNNADSVWTIGYKPKYSYFGVSEADYPQIDILTVKAGGTVCIPNGSKIEVWRLY